MSSRRPWGLRSSTLPPLSWTSGGLSGVTIYADQNETSSSLGAANCETVVTFVGPWGGASGVTPYTDQNETWPPRGAANCETVAVFMGSWDRSE